MTTAAKLAVTGNLSTDTNHRHFFVMFTFLISFLVYLFTLSPTISAGDSAELITSAISLGIAHPPGYPLYCLIGKIFNFLIPWGNSAYRVNLLSGFFAAGAIFLLGEIIKGIVGKKYWIYLTGPLIFAFSLSFWSGAVIAEVFSLHLFIAGLILLSLVKDKFRLVVFLLLGIGLANQQTIILMVPGLLYWGWVKFRRKNFSFAEIRLGLIFLLTGILLYLYLPLRSAHHPIENWGKPGNFKNFLRVITRADYGSFRLVAKNPRTYSLKNSLEQTISYFRQLNKEFTLFGIILFFAGIYYLFRAKRRDLAVCLLIIFFSSGLGFALWANLPLDSLHLSALERFSILPKLVFAVLGSLGLIYFLEYFPRFAFLSLALPLFFLLKGFPVNNQRNIFLAYDYGTNLLRGIPRGGQLFIRADSEVFILSYLTKIEERRKDLTIYDETGEVFNDIAQEKLNSLMTHPEKIFFTAESFLMRKIKNPHRYGLLNQMAKYRDDNPFLFFATRSLPEIKFFHNYRTRNIAAQYYVALADFYWRQKKDPQKGKFYYHTALSFAPDISWIRTYLGNNYLREGKDDEAMNEYQMVAMEDAGNAEAHYNLAITWQRKGRFDAAIEEFLKAKNLDPEISLSCDKNLMSLYYLKGNEYYYSQKFSEAIKMYQTVLQFNPQSVDVYCNLAAAYFSQGLPEKAVESYQRAISISPQNIEAHLNLGNIYGNLGKFIEAEQEWRKVLQINSQEKRAKENLKKLFLMKK